MLSAGSKPCFLYLSLEQVCTHRHESSAVPGTARTETGIKMPGTKLSSHVLGGLPKAKILNLKKLSLPQSLQPYNTQTEPRAHLTAVHVATPLPPDLTTCISILNRGVLVIHGAAENTPFWVSHITLVTAGL